MGMLNAFTEANGATAIVPGSHKDWRAPTTAEDHGRTLTDHVRITGQAGDALVYTGQHWHLVPLNYTTEALTAVLRQFLPYYVISMEAHVRATPAAVLRALPPQAAALIKEKLVPCYLWEWPLAPPLSLLRR